MARNREAQKAFGPMMLSAIEHQEPPGRRLVDDNPEQALGDVDAVVILGAGFDTSAYRLARRSDLPGFEVDQPLNVDRKKKAVARALGTPPACVRLVPVDFERDDLMATLASHGYRAETARSSAGRA